MARRGQVQDECVESTRTDQFEVPVGGVSLRVFFGHVSQVVLADGLAPNILLGDLGTQRAERLLGLVVDPVHEIFDERIHLLDHRGDLQLTRLVPSFADGDLNGRDQQLCEVTNVDYAFEDHL